MVFPSFGQVKKIITVACYQYTFVLNGPKEDSLVSCVSGQDIFYQFDLMAILFENPSYINGNVMIQQELHSFMPASCWAITRSISSLWSS